MCMLKWDSFARKQSKQHVIDGHQVESENSKGNQKEEGGV